MKGSKEPLDFEDVPRNHPLIAAFDLHASTLSQHLSGNALSGTSIREGIAYDWDLTERALKLLLTEVRVRRNASLPVISKLPLEILSMIFSLVASTDPPQASLSEAVMRHYVAVREEVFDDLDSNTWEYLRILEHGSLGWIRLTHVCKLWRRILLDTPELWANHVGRLPRATSECLRRAGSTLPLTVTATCISEYHEQYTSLVPLFTHLARLQVKPFWPRFRELHVVDLRPSFFRIDETYADTELTHLEVLDISRVNGDTSPEEGFVRTWDMLPVVRAPRLHTLILRNIVIPWNSSSLVYLSLHLRYCESIPSPALIGLLSQTRESLRFLELFWASQSFRLGPGFDTAAIKEILLPNLHTLHFADSDEQEKNFLQIVRLPPTVKLKLDIYCEPVYDPDWNSHARLGLPVALALERSQCGPELDGLFVASSRLYPESQHDTRIDLEMHCYAASFVTNFDGLPIADRPKLHLVADANGSPPYWLDNVLISMCRAVSPSRFIFASFDLPFWLAADIRAVVSHFPNLRFLRVLDPLKIDYKSENPFGPAPYLGEAINEDPEIAETDGQEGGQGDANDNENWEDGRDAAFPYLPGIASGASLSAGSASPLSRRLKMLWLVQSRALQGTFAAWCEHVARQLRNSQQQTTTLPPKPVEILRIEFTTRISDEELSSAENLVYGTFEELADVVQWKINRG